MNQESQKVTVPKGAASRLAKLSVALGKLDSLTPKERLELLDAWEFLGARWRVIHTLLSASVTRPSSPSAASPPDDVLLTVPEVAAQLRVGASRVYQLIRSKALPPVMIGERQVRVSRSALQAYLKQVTEKEPQS